MLRALLWKEWRELRLLRLTGLGLGLVLPLAFLLGAEGFRRGMLPFGGSGSYSLDDLFHRVLPTALALGLWPLFSLLTVAQSFCGDRASGREAFLLERPVGRGRVFLARALTSLGSVLVIVVGTTAAGWAIAWLTTGKAPDPDFSLPLLAGGVAISILALLAGLGAAALLQSPMAAVLLAVLFGAIPFVLGTQLGGLFPLAAFGDTPVGLVLPWLLLPAYALAAWVGLCRGEPAGRGRLVRSLVTIGAALGVILLGFPVLAAASLRAGGSNGWIFASRRSETAVVVAGGPSLFGRGRIVDLATGRSLRFLPPPIGFAVWNDAGTRVAVATRSGPLGSFGDLRLEIYDARGNFLRSFPAADSSYLKQGKWVGDDLVVLAGEAHGKRESTRLWFLRPGDGDAATLDLPGAAWTYGFLGPTRGDVLYLAIAQQDASGATVTEIRSIDVAHRSLASSPVVHDPNAASGGSLSPSGKYWLRRDRGEGLRPSHVVDLDSGKEVEGLVASRQAAWIDGDEVAWLDRKEGKARLLAARPGAPARVVAQWPHAVAGIEPGPEGGAAIVHVLPERDGPPEEREEKQTASTVDEGAVQQREAPEVLLYRDGRFFEIPLTAREREQGIDVHWAGAKKLARIGPDSLTFEDVPSR